MIKLINVNMSYPGREVLRNINLEIEPGETMVIIGPSGSGKSTLLRLIIGLLKPTSGEVWVDRKEISHLNEDELNEIRKNMGMVFQYSALFDSMTVGENVAFGLRQHKQIAEEKIVSIVQDMLKMVGLEGQEAVMPSELSGGMKKRVSLARAMAIKPQIVLYDEPTAGLDPIMSSIIDELIVSTKSKLGGVTSVVVTHDMSSAFSIADRIAMIYDGCIIEIGSVDDIKKSANPIVQQFIHGWHRPSVRHEREEN